jgi:hypothetical protein
MQQTTAEKGNRKRFPGETFTWPNAYGKAEYMPAALSR